MNEKRITMAFIVEMYGIPKETPKNRGFDCGAHFWETMLNVGKRYGWAPMGTLPTPDCMEAFIKGGNFKNDYEPIMWGFQKMVLSKDAQKWAEALERAVKETDGIIDKSKTAVLLKDGMSAGEFRDANRMADTKNITEFIEFLRKGGFGFTWDD